MDINENTGACKSQTERILDYMLQGHSITPLEALDRFKCNRLAARISEIKARGYLVYSEFVTTNTEKKVKQYYM
jgi:hypothetical protein